MAVYAATSYVSKAVLDDAMFDVRRHVAEQLRSQIEEATEGQGLVPNSWRLESEAFRDEHEERGRGVRRLLEWMRILKPRVVVIEGEQFRASIRTYDSPDPASLP